MPKRSYRLYFKGTGTQKALSTSSSTQSTNTKHTQSTAITHTTDTGDKVFQWEEGTGIEEERGRRGKSYDSLSTPFGSLGWFVDVDAYFPFSLSSSSTQPGTGREWVYNWFLGGYVVRLPKGTDPHNDFYVYDWGDVVKVMEWDAVDGYYEVWVPPWKQDEYRNHPRIILRVGY